MKTENLFNLDINDLNKLCDGDISMDDYMKKHKRTDVLLVDNVPHQACSQCGAPADDQCFEPLCDDCIDRMIGDMNDEVW